MGFFRGGFILLLGILLFVSLLLANSLFILQSSLKYENVKEGLYPIVQNLSTGSGNIFSEIIPGDFNLTKVAKDNVDEIQRLCQNRTEYVFTYKEYTINIPCTANATNPNIIIEETFNDVIHDIYYKEYNCSFLKCFTQNELPFFLVSEKAKNYWNSRFYFFLIASLILSVLIFFFAEEKRNTPLIIGSLLVISSFITLKIKNLAEFLAGDIFPFVQIFFSKSHSVFLFSFILGIILIISGIALRFFGWNSIKEKFSKKEIKEIVKEEVSEEKKTKKKK